MHQILFLNDISTYTFITTKYPCKLNEKLGAISEFELS